MDLLQLFHNEIPITKALGVFDIQFENEKLSLKAPLSVNVNHKGTFFGGTMYSCAALAAYGLFLSSLRQRNYFTNNIVVAEGKFKYLKPVEGDISVQAVWPSEDEREKFFVTLQSKGKARVTINVEVFSKELLCGQFSGEFVAFLK